MHTHPVYSTYFKTSKFVYLCNDAMHLCKLCWSMILVKHREIDWAKLASTDGLFLHVDRRTVKLPWRHESARMPKQKASQHVAEGTHTAYSLVLSGKKEMYFKCLEYHIKNMMEFCIMVTWGIPIDFINYSILLMTMQKSPYLCLRSVCSVMNLQV